MRFFFQAAKIFLFGHSTRSVGTHLMDGIGVELQCWDCTATDGLALGIQQLHRHWYDQKSFGYQRVCLFSLHGPLHFQLRRGFRAYGILPQSLDRLLLSSFLY